ncbi:MAG: hypothetical protein JW749_02530 [Sedimentisphaerales bacterium]|nr:hypothetical protein [Sedimentisphaerales bacterium]
MKEPNKKEGLDETCESFVGHLLMVHPIYGWGWEGNEETPNPPLPFKMRLERLWWHDGIRRGGIGVIEDAGHKYSGFKVIFDLRHYGEFNFTTKTGHYNIEIAESCVVENDKWPLPVVKKGNCGGYAEIKAYEQKN